MAANRESEVSKSLGHAARVANTRNEKREKDREASKHEADISLKREANAIAKRTSFIAFLALVISGLSLVLSIASLVAGK
ncbi:hypothetical protein ACOSZC_02575 [Marinobacter salsuginis]